MIRIVFPDDKELERELKQSIESMSGYLKNYMIVTPAIEGGFAFGIGDVYDQNEKDLTILVHTERIEEGGIVVMPTNLQRLTIMEGNPNWMDDGVQMIALVKEQIKTCNDILNSRGYLSVNDVREALGFPRVLSCEVCGWIREEEPITISYDMSLIKGVLCVTFDMATNNLAGKIDPATASTEFLAKRSKRIVNDGYSNWFGLEG